MRRFFIAFGTGVRYNSKRSNRFCEERVTPVFLLVFSQVLVMFLLMAIGFLYARKTNMKSEECARVSNILLMIVTPCLLLENLQRDFSKEMQTDLLFSFVLAAITSLLALGLSNFVFLRKGGGENRRTERYAASFGNVGFIGIPLITGIFGEEYAVFAVSFVVVFHLFSWTFGVAILKGRDGALSWKEAVLNPGVISALVGVTLFLLKISLPGPIRQTVRYISSLNTPLAMLVCGFFIAGVRWKNAPIKDVVYTSCVRLVLIPAVTMALYWVLGVHRLVPDGSMLVLVNLVSCACPAAIATSMMASRYRLDGEYASLIVSVTTAGCLLTIPVFTVAGRYLFGV